jgi:hypothetical protein
MHFVTFIVVLVFTVLAAVLFATGMVQLHKENHGTARGLISSGFMLGLLGVMAGAVIFGFFNI